MQKAHFERESSKAMDVFLKWKPACLPGVYSSKDLGRKRYFMRGAGRSVDLRNLFWDLLKLTCHCLLFEILSRPCVMF